LIGRNVWPVRNMRSVRVSARAMCRKIHPLLRSGLARVGSLSSVAVMVVHPLALTLAITW
jgi:hypothetical protein